MPPKKKTHFSYQRSVNGPASLKSLAAKAVIDLLTNAVPGGPVAKSIASSVGQSAYNYATKSKGKTPAYKRGPYKTKTKTASNTKSKAVVLSTGSSKWKGTSTGAYGGKFATPQKIRASIESICSSRGYHHTSELWGRVEDPHCAYIIHSTYNRDRIIRVILGALVRKLFTKAGIEVNNNRSELPLADWANSAGYRITLITQSPIDGAKGIVANYNTVDNQAFVDLLNAMSAFTAYFESYINDTTDPISPPCEMHLYSLRDPGTWNLASSINLRTEMLTIFSQSTLRVQNRSAAAEAAAADKYDLDRVDNQPLTGFIHEFSNADPRMKSMSSTVPTAVNEHLLCSNTASGLRLVRANAIQTPAALTDFSDYQEPPVAQAFKNCVKSTKVILQPGEMKTTSIYHVYKGTLITLLNKLRIQLIVSGVVSGVPGKAQMLVLEEKIRTTLTNPITIQYERQTKIGCISQTRKMRSLLKSEFHAGNIDELPP